MPEPQRQDSLDDQLRTVRDLANRAGCYDAADWIRARTLVEPPPAVEEQGDDRHYRIERHRQRWAVFPLHMHRERIDIAVGESLDVIPLTRLTTERHRTQVAEGALRELAEAVHRLNGDWQNEDCGDPRCGTEGCEYVRTVKRILDGVLGTSYL